MSMETIDSRGMNLCRGPLAITTQRMPKLCSMWFHSRLVILPICPKQYVTFPTALSYGDIDVGRFFCSKSMETIDPRGVAKFDPRGMFGTIYNVDYQTLLQTKLYKLWALWF